MDDEQFAILFVCTGNICRSPAAEHLARADLGLPRSVGVGSAGTAALAGEPVSPPMAELLSRMGVNTSGFAARQLDQPMVRAADLILTMTTRHRSAVVGLHPPAVQRTFTLLELAGLLRDVPAEHPGRTAVSNSPAGWRALIDLAKSRRGWANVGATDVPDPYGGPTHEYIAALDLIVGALDTLRRLLSHR